MQNGKNQKPYDLEERLILFALLIIEIVEMLPSTRVGNHVGGQLLRSGTSPTFHYGEAQVAESQDDFVHKMKVCLKELKETNIALQIVKRKPLVKDFVRVDKAASECRELIAIFVTSIKTATKNKLTEAKKKFDGKSNEKKE